MGVGKVTETGLSVAEGGLRCGDKHWGIVGTQHRKCRHSPHSPGSDGQGPGCRLCSCQGSSRAGAVLSAWTPRLPWKRLREEGSPWKWHSICHAAGWYPHSSALLQWGMRCGLPVCPEPGGLKHVANIQRCLRKMKGGHFRHRAQIFRLGDTNEPVSTWHGAVAGAVAAG